MSLSAKISFKQVLPHLISVAIFLLLTIAFYHPLILSNKSFNQHDVLQGSSAAQELKEYREITGEEGLWTNSIFSGMPGYLISVDWSDGALEVFQQVISLNLPSSAQVTFLSMLCFYVLLLAFGVRPYLALAGAIAYGLGTFAVISIEAGHIFKVRAMAYIPLVLAGVHLVFHNPKKLLGIGLLAIAIALEIKANHPQITYYLFLFLLIYGVNELVIAIKDKAVGKLARNLGLILIAATLGVGANIGKLWSIAEYSKYSTRGKSDLTTTNTGKSGLDRDYVFSWSHGISESFTLLIPNFSGGASMQALSESSELASQLKKNGLSKIQIKEQLNRIPTYHGDQPSVAGPVYVGAIVIFLFFIGLLVLSKRNKVYLLVATIIFLMLSWGKNLDSVNYFLFDYLPGYNKFRSVSMAMSIVLLTVPLLGFLGIEQLMKEGLTKENRKKLLIAVGATGGLALLLAISAGAFNYSASVDSRLGNVPQWFIEAIRADRESMLRSDAFRSAILIALVATGIYFYLPKKLSSKFFFSGLVLLVTFDLWFVDRRYVNDESFQAPTKGQLAQKSAADELILKDKDEHYRVFNLINPWNEAETGYFHSSIGGYHGAKMKRYQELIDRCLNSELQSVISELRGGQVDMSNHYVLNMLNTKYLKFGEQAQNVIKNSNASGNAWFVSKVSAVSSADEAIDETCKLQSNSVAVINTTKFPLSASAFKDPGQISLETYEPNYLKYQTKSSSPGLAVFSEIYYPVGWTAYIDGTPQEILAANYVLRALEIPAGDHTIEFKFEPSSYVIGDKIMLICSILIVFGFIGIVVYTSIKE